MMKLGERDSVCVLNPLTRKANIAGKLFSNISKSDIPTDTPSSPLDLNKTRPHAIPESDGSFIFSITLGCMYEADIQFWLEYELSYLIFKLLPMLY
jgi:hypothetical protein